MKSIFKYISLLTVAVVLLFSATSCEDFLDVNVDPNNPTEVTPDLVLPTGLQYTSRYLKQDRYLSHLGNMFMYNWSQSDGFSWYEDEFLYNVTSSFYDQLFDFAYGNALKQYQVLDQPDDPLMANYAAISKIMKAYHFQILVDLYGDIPYSEALLRKDEATPKYDEAEVVYSDLFDQLTAAIDLINNADVEALAPTENDDVVFQGDMNAWIEFANTIKLRLLVRAQNTDVFDAADWATVDGASFISDDVIINPGYLVEENKQNPLWDDLGWDASGTQTLSSKATCATDYILEYLENTSDPRIDYLYEKPEDGHLGVPQGLEDYDTPVLDAYVPEKVSNIGPGILKSGTMGSNIFTLAESYLLQAEAVQIGELTGDAQALYEAGVKASFDYLGTPGSGTYLSLSIVNTGWNASPDKIEAIITQKWLATNGITAEQSWFDYSRTGFPSGLPISRTADTPNDERPVRLLYPSGEISANGGEVPAQVNSLAFTEKVFWAE